MDKENIARPRNRRSESQNKSLPFKKRECFDTNIPTRQEKRLESNEDVNTKNITRVTRSRVSRLVKSPDSSSDKTRTPLSSLRLSNDSLPRQKSLDEPVISSTASKALQQLQDFNDILTGAAFDTIKKLTTPNSQRSSLESGDAMDAANVRGAMDGDSETEPENSHTSSREKRSVQSTEQRSIDDSPTEEDYEKSRVLLHKHLRGVVMRLASSLEGPISPVENEFDSSSSCPDRSNKTKHTDASFTRWVVMLILALGVAGVIVLRGNSLISPEKLSTLNDMDQSQMNKYAPPTTTILTPRFSIPPQDAPSSQYMHKEGTWRDTKSSTGVLFPDVHRNGAPSYSSSSSSGASSSRQSVAVDTVPASDDDDDDGVMTVVHVMCAMGAVFVIALGCIAGE